VLEFKIYFSDLSQVKRLVPRSLNESYPLKILQTVNAVVSILNFRLQLLL
jgi:hypothetical protein